MEKQLATIIIQALLNSDTPAVSDAGYDAFTGLLKADLMRDCTPAEWEAEKGIYVRRHTHAPRYYVWKE